MKGIVCFTFTVLLTVALAGCATPIQISPTTAPTQTPILAEGMLRPGDKIGEMTIEQGAPTLIRPYIWQFCEYMPDEHTPTSSAGDCEVPLMSGVTITFGWLAKESKFQSNWDAMTWELSIDGYKINLEAFDWHEFDYPAHGEGNKERSWIINLKNPSPGRHNLR
jgi:hypothetical protein